MNVIKDEKVREMLNALYAWRDVQDETARVRFAEGNAFTGTWHQGEAAGYSRVIAYILREFPRD